MAWSEQAGWGHWQERAVGEKSSRRYQLLPTAVSWPPDAEQVLFSLPLGPRIRLQVSVPEFSLNRKICSKVTQLNLKQTFATSHGEDAYGSCQVWIGKTVLTPKTWEWAHPDTRVIFGEGSQVWLQQGWDSTGATLLKGRTSLFAPTPSSDLGIHFALRSLRLVGPLVPPTLVNLGQLVHRPLGVVSDTEEVDGQTFPVCKGMNELTNLFDAALSFKPCT